MEVDPTDAGSKVAVGRWSRTYNRHERQKDRIDSVTERLQGERDDKEGGQRR
jgi:hypothetical protein